jgi:hypothetical protein
VRACAQLVKVFVPAMMCVCAIVFALIVNQSLCCSAGCCCRPTKTDQAAPSGTATQKDGEAVVMSV